LKGVKKEMRKMLLTPLIVSMVALLLTMSMSTVHATKPIPVSGTFDYTFEIQDNRYANDHWIFEAEEYETWVGDFEGPAVSFFRVVYFNFVEDPTLGPLNVWLRSDFEGTVMGKEGTLVIQLVGWRYLPGDWYGQWVIISGTGELANLHGQGTWGGPGFGDPGPDIWYSGQIHFSPG
jgi:hypothetical protein